MHHPDVCIMIPSYNQAGFIITAVESALAQDYPSLQVVVADDNSEDDTELLLQPYINAGKIKYVKNTTNLGRVANYHQTLYAHTDADWVINLDADDHYTNPGYITAAMAAIKNAASPNILFYQGLHLIKDGTTAAATKSTINQPLVMMSGADYFLNYFSHKHFSHLATLYNRKLAIQHGFYEKDILSADIYSVLHLCIAQSTAMVLLSNTIAGVWLHHSGNTSKNAGSSQHHKNFMAFSSLYQQALAQGFNKWRCFIWRLQVTKSYLFTRVRLLFSKIKYN